MPKRKPSASMSPKSVSGTSTKKRKPPSQRMQGKQVSGFIPQADYATIKQAASAAGLSPWLFIRAAAIEKAQEARQNNPGAAMSMSHYPQP